MSATQGKARPDTPVLLDVRDLHVAYGKAEVVHGVSFDVRAGEFVVMLGRNGAGKSTSLHAICGLIPKKGGRVTFGGKDISNADPRTIVTEGIVNVLEGHRVFTTLTVEDNLLIGTYAKHSHGDRTNLDRIYSIFPEIAEKKDQLASRLSGGQQQILAVAQGMMGDPKLLILDEPSGGLAPVVIDRILQIAADLARSGVAILLVEQLVEKALRHANHVVLLANGKVAASGSPDELQQGNTIQRILVGTHETH
jgi:branched-chain amino acid transport system ATP-binding protein